MVKISASACPDWTLGRKKEVAVPVAKANSGEVGTVGTVGPAVLENREWIQPINQTRNDKK